MPKQRDAAREAEELSALRALGTDIFELRQAVFMVEQIDKQVMTFAKALDLQRHGFSVYCLTDEESGAREYALHHLGDLARKLLDNFDRIEGHRRTA